MYGSLYFKKLYSVNSVSYESNLFWNLNGKTPKIYCFFPHQFPYLLDFFVPELFSLFELRVSLFWIIIQKYLLEGYMCKSILIENFHRRFSSIDITESTQYFPMNLKLHVNTIIRTMFYAYYTNCNVISNFNCVLPTFFRSLSLNVSNVIKHGKMLPLKLLWDRILSRFFWQDRKISGKNQCLSSIIIITETKSYLLADMGWTKGYHELCLIFRQFLHACQQFF